MNHSEILNRVKSLVSETLEIDVTDIDESTTFEDVDADSFDLLELVTAIEDEFDITVDADSFADVKSVGDAVDIIEKAL